MPSIEPYNKNNRGGYIIYEERYDIIVGDQYIIYVLQEVPRDLLPYHLFNTCCLYFTPTRLKKKYFVIVCVCVCFLPIHSGHQVRWTYQPGSHRREGHTGFLIHLLSAVRALIFLARRIQPFLSLVDREVEFCILINDLIVLHPLGIFILVFLDGQVGIHCG